MELDWRVSRYRYRPEMDIRNVDSLPAGLNCRFLVCIKGEDGALIAKRWARKKPGLGLGEVSVDFGRPTLAGAAV